MTCSIAAPSGSCSGAETRGRSIASTSSQSISSGSATTTGLATECRHAPAGPTCGASLQVGSGSDEEHVEALGGGDALEDLPERAPRSRKQYKIQEVIKRRQVLLV